MGERLDEQLAAQTQYVHTHDRWLRYDAGTNELHLTPLYDWYGQDFRPLAPSVMHYAARFVPPLQAALASGRRPALRWGLRSGEARGKKAIADHDAGPRSANQHGVGKLRVPPEPKGAGRGKTRQPARRLTLVDHRFLGDAPAVAARVGQPQVGVTALEHDCVVADVVHAVGPLCAGDHEQSPSAGVEMKNAILPQE